MPTSRNTSGKTNPDEYLLAKEFVEKVACLLLPALDAYLTELTNAQFGFLGIIADGPFMPEWQCRNGTGPWL